MAYNQVYNADEMVFLPYQDFMFQYWTDFQADLLARQLRKQVEPTDYSFMQIGSNNAPHSYDTTDGCLEDITHTIKNWQDGYEYDLSYYNYNATNDGRIIPISRTTFWKVF